MTCRFRLSVLLAGSVALPTLGAAASAATCESLRNLVLPHTTITSATVVAATSTVPQYCQVAAVSKPTSDSNINILIALPTAGWNGKYMQLGNGGFAGSVSPPVSAVQRGYAGAATDDGHQAGGTDASWALGHPQKIIDFGYRSLKETTDTAKAVVRAFYGKRPDLSYFQGCSDGGREALMEAQRFPNDWDGIIVGAPANFWTHHFTGFIWNEQALHNNPASNIPASKLPAIQAAALAKCDARDGVTDGVVEDPSKCSFDPSVLKCAGGETDSCLTSPQVTALKKIMAGPKTHSGEQIFPGYFFNAAAAPGYSPWMIDGAPIPIQFQFGNEFFANMVFDVGDANFDFRKVNFDGDVRRADNKRVAGEPLSSVLNSTDPDLGPLERRGAKMIMWHGFEDPAIAPVNSINYYKSVVAEDDGGHHGHDGWRDGRHDGGHGSLSRTRNFFRLFMAPGVLHCGGGPGPNSFDMLTALEQWVEHDVAPDRIIATKFVNDDPTQGVVRTRPLCPWPQTSTYTGHGSTNDAANFECSPVNTHTAHR